MDKVNEIAEKTITTVQLEIEPHFLGELAQRRGYNSIEDYLLALIDQDDDALWNEQFASMPDKLLKLEAEALAEPEEDLSENIDLDTYADKL